MPDDIYMVELMHAEPEFFADKLNHYASEGWRVNSVVSYPGLDKWGNVLVVFERWSER